MNKIQTAAKLLRQVAKEATDATAFTVKVNKTSEMEEIVLSPDKKRRQDTYIFGDTFFHTDRVVSICQALGLHYYFTGRPVDAYHATFEVRIYEYK